MRRTTDFTERGGDENVEKGQLLNDVVFPRLVKARQNFPGPEPVDVEREILRELSRPQITSRVDQGKRIAVAVGSRGIADIDRIVRGVVKQLKELGGEPFIVPAMGSHGGATAEGQADVLAHLGITEETVGAPVMSSMEVVQLGASASGVPVYVDKLAHGADATVVINRVKPHTAFRGPIESGLMKMLGIGLGKEKGASAIHALGFERFDTLIPELSRHIIERGNVIFGVAVVENAREQPVKLVAVEPERIEEVDRDLLIEARTLMARILFPQLHVLVVREIGKNISGDGMDPNVTGRYLSHLQGGEPEIQKIVVLDLTEETYGNALGIGMADVTTRRLVDKIDYYPMYVNAVTSRLLSGSKIPVTMETDKEAVAAALKSCWGVEPGNQKMMVIQNTLSLHEVYVSEPMLDDARTLRDVEILSGPFEMTFNASGTVQFPPA